MPAFPSKLAEQQQAETTFQPSGQAADQQPQIILSGIQLLGKDQSKMSLKDKSDLLANKGLFMQSAILQANKNIALGISEALYTGIGGIPVIGRAMRASKAIFGKSLEDVHDVGLLEKASERAGRIAQEINKIKSIPDQSAEELEQLLRPQQELLKTIESDAQRIAAETGNDTEFMAIKRLQFGIDKTINDKKAAQAAAQSAATEKTQLAKDIEDLELTPDFSVRTQGGGPAGEWDVFRASRAAQPTVEARKEEIRRKRRRLAELGK